MMSKIFLISFLFILLVLSNTVQSGPYSDIYKDVKPSVVFIQANNSQNEPLSQGTGFFIDKAGYIITNFHIIDGSSLINVTIANGYTYTVKNVLAKDISSDLACLSVDIPSQLVNPIKMNTTPPEVGEDIFVIGYPEGPGGPVQSMTRGIVSSVQTLNEYGEVIQIDAAVSPGASGSPLVNMKCEAIGVTTFGYIKGQNQNFAVSYLEISKLIEKISVAHGGKPIIEWNLTSEEELYAKAIDLFRKGDYNQSLYYSDLAIELNPLYAEAWYEKGLALKNLGKYEEAIKAFDKAIEINPQYAEAQYEKGMELYNMGKDEEALRAYEKAIEIDPEYSAAWTLKGVSLNVLGNYNEAIQAFDKAIEIDPQSAATWNNKGFSLNYLGKFNEAIQAYNRAIEIDPEYSGAWINKGAALDDLGKHNEAILSYDRAIEICPQDATAWINKGVALADQGKDDEAIQAYDKAIEINPQYATALVNKGNALVRQGNYDEAIKAYDKATEINPQYATAWIKKGDALYVQDKYDEAIRAYDRAIEANSSILLSHNIQGHGTATGPIIGGYDKAFESGSRPQYAIAWNKKGNALKALGRTREANAAFAKAKELGYPS